MTVAGFAFDQTERLTVRLHGLIRSYPRGVGIIKEFIQNADDAGARYLKVVLDRRSHAADRLPDPRMRALLGPALLLCNDKRFSEKDLLAIRRIGESSKVESGPKTGRFGLGFNTAYNVTDYPSFLSNDAVYCFDPHQNAVAHPPHYGRGWRITDLWSDAPDWPAAFECGGLCEGETDYNGTIFRLPIRTPAQAARSEISQDPFTVDDFRAIVTAAAAMGSELLLFTKHLLELNVVEIDEAGSTTVRLHIETINLDEVQAKRTTIVAALKGELSALLESWGERRQELELVHYQHHFRVNCGEPREELWQIVNGFARGKEQELLEAALEMVRHGEKAVPWVGAAARLDADGKIIPVAGNLYCALPLPVAIRLPVHINGYFDLDSSRQRLTADQGDLGAGMAARVRWNRALMEQGAAMAWALLIRDLARTFPDGFYSIWPDPLDQSNPLSQQLARGVYGLLTRWKVLRARRSDHVVAVYANQLQLPPSEWRDALLEPLVADGMRLPDPALPPHVEEGLSGELRALTPPALRQRLRRDNDLDTALELADRACLRRRDWVEALLKFCLSDKSEEISGLPLAMTSDGRLRAFGHQAIFIATEAMRALFAGFPSWFLDAEFERATGVHPVPAANLFRMRIHDLVDRLSEIVGDTAPHPFHPTQPSPPNQDWLRALFQLLASHKLEDATIALLKERPIIPGSDGQLHHACGGAQTPLLPPEGEDNEALLPVLRKVGIPFISVEWANAIRPIAAQHPILVPRLGGPALLHALFSRRDGLGRLDNASVEPLLDFLAEPRWSYTDDGFQKLRQLPIFPASTGIVRAGDDRVYLPAGFQPPSIGLDIHLLEGGERWKSLFGRMKVSQLDERRFALDCLLPKMPSLPPQPRRDALTWIRDNLFKLLMDPTQKELRTKVADVPAVVAIVAGKRLWRSIRQLHDPTSDVIKEVLGDAALYPDKNEYRDHPELWDRLFLELGMERKPRPDELYVRLRSLAERGLDAEKDLHRAFEHVTKNWDELSKLTLTFGANRVPMPKALADLAWFPPRRESKKLCFRAAETRLHRAPELYLDEDLVGSEAPVALWSVPADFATALGFRRVPELPRVVKHFENVLAAWESDNHAGVAPEEYGKAASPIYRYLSRLSDKPGHNVDVTYTLKAEDSRALDLLRGRPCLWDPRTQRFWLPAHTFSTPVPFFGPRRVHLEGEPLTKDALDRLGRRGEPRPADFVDFIRELHADDRVLMDTERLSIIESLRRLVDADVPSDLPLLTRDDRLAPPSKLYQDDAPWLRDRLKGIAVTAAEVPQTLLERLGVRRVSASFEEKLVDVEAGAADALAQDTCRQLASRLRLPAFLGGIVRLVRHFHGPDSEVDATPIQHLRIQPAKRLEAEVFLDGTRSLGRSEVKYFYLPQGNALLITGNSKTRLISFLARTIERLLGELAPENLAPLEHMLSCEETEIDEVLDEDHITDARVEDAEIDWSAVDASATAEAPAKDDPHESARREEAAFWSADGTLADEGDVTGSDKPRAEISSSPGTMSFGAGSSEHWSASSSMPRDWSSLLARLVDKPLALDPNTPWSDASGDRPPIEPGAGRSFVDRGGAGGQSIMIDPEGAPEALSETDQREMAECEEAALERVMELECAESRRPERNVEPQLGYDIVSHGTDGPRYIQVKGLARDWRDHPVQLTHSQVACMLAHGDRAWLYVVERLRGTPRDHRIHNPASRIGRIRFDATWAAFADDAPGMREPAEGMRLLGPDGLIGVIVEVRKTTHSSRLTVEMPGGGKTSLNYRPSVHRLEAGRGHDAT